MANNYDRLFNQAQGDALITVLGDIAAAMGANGSGFEADYSVIGDNEEVISSVKVSRDTTDALTIGKKVKDVSNLFMQGERELEGADYIYFNNSINFTEPSSVTNMSGMLMAAQSYDRELNIPDSARDCSYLFYSSGMTQEVDIPEGVTNCALMFADIYVSGNGNTRFPQIPNTCENAFCMFYSCYAYDGYYIDENEDSVVQTYHIPASVTDVTEMFASSPFNSNVEIAEGVTSLSNLFNYATDFNQPVTIPNTVVNCYGMFANSGFNQALNIPDSVENAANMFSDTPIEFEPINIGNNVVNCSGMLSGTTLKRNVTIPDSVEDCSYMFSRCGNTDRNIFINRTVTPFNCYGMLSSMNTKSPTRIFCNNLSLLTDGSLMGSTALTWEEIDNGYQNTAYNISLLNNYPS